MAGRVTVTAAFVLLFSSYVAALAAPEPHRRSGYIRKFGSHRGEGYGSGYGGHIHLYGVWRPNRGTRRPPSESPSTFTTTTNTVSSGGGGVVDVGGPKGTVTGGGGDGSGLIGGIGGGGGGVVEVGETATGGGGASLIGGIGGGAEATVTGGGGAAIGDGGGEGDGDVEVFGDVCRYYCRAPSDETYCCETNDEPLSTPTVKGGLCPAAVTHCSRDPSPRPCSSDGACPGVFKCCFDSCRKRHVCTPPTHLLLKNY